MAEENGLSVASRLDRLEQLLSSAGDLILDNRARTEWSEDRLERMEELMVSAGELLQSASARIDRVSERLDGLASSSEPLLSFVVKSRRGKV